MPEQQKYSDLPPGATVIQDSRGAQQYSDLPPGAKVVSESDTTPLAEQGMVRRFATRALGLPERMFDHPGDYLNPFSKGYRERPFVDPGAIPEEFPTPGKQTMRDIKDKNYAGALGDVLPAAVQVAMAAEPALREYSPSGNIPKMLLKTAVGNTLGRIPLVGDFEALRPPTWGQWGAALKPNPQMGLFRNTPKLGDAPAASASALDRPVMRSATAEAPPAAKTAPESAETPEKAGLYGKTKPKSNLNKNQEQLKKASAKSAPEFTAKANPSKEDLAFQDANMEDILAATIGQIARGKK